MLGRRLRVILTAVVLVLVGFVLQWLSFWVYPGSLVNYPLKVEYEYGFLTFTRVVYYGGGLVLRSPPQLDYLQLFSIIAAIYLLFGLGRRK